MFDKFTKNLRELIFPSGFTCDVCGAETFNGNLCADCLKTITFNNQATCPVCGRKTVRPEICFECKDNPPLFKQAVSSLVYKDGAVALVHKFKNGNGYLKDYFAELIAANVKKLPKPDCIVYVPMTDKAVRRRGYNQGQLLADSLSKLIGVPVAKNAVTKIKQTAEQKALNRREREQNLHGCFKINDKNAVKGKTVLILDDILTTGATADEMCKIILRAGANCVYFATVASVEYKLLQTSNK